MERDTVEHRFEIPESIVERGNGMASITVDVDANMCQNAFAYVPDLANYRMYVYSLRENRMWRFSHNYFHFDPLHGDFDVDGLRYQWDDGIFSITLGNRNPDGYRTVYFHPMASVSEFSVSSRVLQNERNSARSNHGDDFQVIIKLQFQVTALLNNKYLAFSWSEVDRPTLNRQCTIWTEILESSFTRKLASTVSLAGIQEHRTHRTISIF